MSTKINVRSPFYLNLTEPIAPLPLFQCGTAGIQNLSIDQQGQISQPSTSLGTILSITSSESDFSNDKFATVSTATDRDLTLRISIPANYSNSAEAYIDCERTIEQPALIVTQPSPSDPPVTCSGGPTTNGSISAVSIDSGGDSDTVNLSSYFSSSNPITNYSVYVANQTLVNASVSGNTLTIFSNNIGGSTNVIVSATDGQSGTCTASQSIAVTVSVPGGVAFACGDAAFSGGGITQAGVITKPNSVAAVGIIKASTGGSAITSHSANTTGSNRSVTLFFDLTVPPGYTNAGSTVECSKEFEQAAANPEFTCSTANLSGQRISKSGIVDYGSAALGSITAHTSSNSGFSNGKFAEVSSDTARTVTFTVTVPGGYSNSGTISCPVNINQPEKASTCGAFNYKLSGPKISASNTIWRSEGDFCDQLFQVSQSVTSTASSIQTALGKSVCKNRAPFAGGNFYYAVSVNRVSVGPGTGKFYLWQIDDEGIIQDVAIHSCPTSPNSGDGQGNGGSL